MIWTLIKVDMLRVRLINSGGKSMNDEWRNDYVLVPKSVLKYHLSCKALGLLVVMMM